MLNQSIRMQLLVYEARRWVGVTEQGGDNQGQMVQIFQKATDNIAQGEPWCAAFVRYCLQQTDAICKLIDPGILPTNLFASEHVMTVWNKTSKVCRVEKPVPGAIAIWQFNKGNLGHMGIVSTVLPSQRQFTSIEGNTGPQSAVVREGDGVYEKTRNLVTTDAMRLLGFLLPY